ncbi:MAG: transposase [Terracidiphilus sp.]
MQSERNAGLLIDVLRSLVAERKFQLHDFVIMPDHVHLLLTVFDEMTIEKAMQLIKGRFSHRLSHELGYKGIANNPVKAGLVDAPEKYPYCFASLARKKIEAHRAQPVTKS